MDFREKSFSKRVNYIHYKIFSGTSENDINANEISPKISHFYLNTNFTSFSITPTTSISSWS